MESKIIGIEMKKVAIIKRYFLYFMMYAVIGWCYEVFLEVFVYRWGFSNRGILFGPYCPIYGFGALICVLIFYRLIKEKPVKQKVLMIPVVFLGCLAVATLIELVASYICEGVVGYWPWQTYVDYELNFQGRIALSPSLRFGLGGLIFIYILQPLFEKLTQVMSCKIRDVVFLALAVVLGADIIIFVSGL